MERAIPSIKGRIDKYGYYTDTARPSRVALSCYGTYYTQAEIIDFIKKARASPDPYQYVSRGGVPLPEQLTGASGAARTNLAAGTPLPSAAALKTNAPPERASSSSDPAKPQ
jgi:hypothetical protein